MKITDEMVEAAANAVTKVDMNFGDEPWQEAVARSALTSALAEQTQQGVEELRRLDDALGNFINAYGDPYEPAEDYEAETERNIKELSDAYNGAHVAGIFSGRSALVDVPAVESESVGWLVRDNDDEEFRVEISEPDICWQKQPLYAHPPRSLSNEGWMPIESVPHNEEVFLGWFDMDGDWVTEVGEGSWGWRNETANNVSHHGSATHWQPLPTPPLSTRKGSAGDGVATGTSGGQDNG